MAKFAKRTTESLKNSSDRTGSKKQSSARQKSFRNILLENLERRELMATGVGPRLLSVSTNSGSNLDFNQTGVTANVLNESPREIVFRFDGTAAIDVNSLTGIRIQREGNIDQNFSTGVPISVTPAYVGFGESERIVIARFSEPLSDDMYRIEILGAGNATPIKNTVGDSLRPRSGDRDTYFMNLELGAKIVAVVPQPTTRVVDSSNPNRTVISQQRNQIEVYFNDDDLGPTATSPQFYQLILTSDSVNPNDDVIFNPSSVTYDAASDKAVLTFANDLDFLASGAGTFRLRVGSNQSAVRSVPLVTPLGADIGDTLNLASNRLGTLSGDVSHILNEQVVVSQSNRLEADYPGSNFDPGHRDIQDEQHLNRDGDADQFTTKRYYSFLLDQPYAQDSQGRPVTSSMTDVQRQRVREVFEFYSAYLGIKFTEATGRIGPDGSPTLQVVVGDLLSGIIGDPGGPGTFVSRTTLDLNGQESLAILDGAELWDNDFGYGTQADNPANPLMIESGRSILIDQILTTPLNLVGPNFFIEAMRTVGSLLGLGQSHDLAPGTIQGFEPLLGRVENPLEQIFPGDQDIVHGQFLYRPDNRDVDVYRFSIPAGQRGTIVAEAVAERLADSSDLDTHLKLFRRDANGVVTLVSSNDNYFSKDSLIRMDVVGEAGVEFFFAVTAKGNENYDPSIKGSGGGGLSDGRYQLRVDYRQAPSATLLDTNGTRLDGDGDGIAGGEFNYWFRVASPIGVATTGNPKTIFVDKDNTSPLSPLVSPLGSPRNAYSRMQDALAVALPGDIVRVMGSAGADKNLSTVGDNLPFEIGDGGPGIGTLSDGRDLNVPRGVSLMIDAGAIFKFSTSELLVGSDNATSDRSGASLQILGTPTRNVYFTSYLDESLGKDTNPLGTTPQRGNWGGIEIRNDVAREQGRMDPELSGIFLNYVASADIRYGGGSVGQGNLARTVNPIHLTSARPTLLNNRITQSADAGMSADPSSFEETLFTETRYQFASSFTPDYSRVGPVIRGNQISASSTNGLFIRIDTLAGSTLKPLDVAARLDDTDITYVLGETLIVNGTPGGSVLETIRPELGPVSFTSTAGGSLVAGQSYTYRMVYVDRIGHEGLPSQPTGAFTATSSNRAVRLNTLPSASGDFLRRRLYRSNPTTPGTWDLVTELDRNSSSYLDMGTALSRGISFAPSSTLELFDGGSPNLSSVIVTPVTDVSLNPVRGLLTPGISYNYRMSIVDALGNEGLAGNPLITGLLPIFPDPLDANQTLPLQLQLAGLPTAPAGSTSRKLYRNDPNVPGRWDLVAVLDNTSTTYVDLAAPIATGVSLTFPTSLSRARPDASLVIDPGIVIKSQGSRIEVGINAQLIAEGTPSKPIIFTARGDDRYGAGATFDTNNDQAASLPKVGDWSGIVGLHLSTVSIDSAVVTFAGGASRVPGGFASFNAIELHQSEARITNSLIEKNASGAGSPGTTRRAARGVNDASAIYVSGSQPIIVNNIIRNNGETLPGLLAQTKQNGETAAISIDVNSLKAVSVLDYGRSIGLNQRIDTGAGNQGPLVSGNRLALNSMNGMRVRGGTLNTEGVWDDTDIVHILQKEIVIPDFHTYGGLRLQSKGDESLVVKSVGATAGFTAMGRPLDVTDRIGGSLQILGSAGFPVVLTSISDCTVGAGFTPDGGAQFDTINACTAAELGDADVVVLMDESASMTFAQVFSVQLIAQLEAGFLAAGVGKTNGNRYGLAGYGDFNPVPHAFVVGPNNSLFGTSTEYATAAAGLQAGGNIEDGWQALDFVLDTYSFRPEASKYIILVTNEDRDVVDTSQTYADLVSRMNDQGIILNGIYTAGIATSTGATALAINATSTVFIANGTGGFTNQPGGSITFTSGTEQTDYIDMNFATGGIAGDINQISAGGLTTQSFTRALVSTFVGQAAGSIGKPGDWRGIVLDTYGNDRNVDTVYEYESDQLSAGGSNNIPSRAQDIGILARDIESGDENVRLGFTLAGVVANPSDVDVYRFTGTAGSMVWFDIDRTSSNLDTVVELVTDDGRIIAMSDNSFEESKSGNIAYFDPSNDGISDGRIYTLDQSLYSKRNINAPGVQVDFQGINPLDAGFRVALPGTPGTTSSYKVRVRSSNVKSTDANPLAKLLDPALVSNGLTYGAYRLQIRLQQTDEIGGSTIRYSDIRFANRAIEVRGGPLHSPLLGELAQPDFQETDQTAVFGGTSGNLSVGNLFNYDRGAVSIAGNLATQTDVDWYRFTINRELSSDISSLKHQSVIFDIDYADGLGRPDTSLWVFTANGAGTPQRLVLIGRDSDITDDKAAPGRGSDKGDITRGSFGSGDAFIGASELPNGTYVVAVTANSQTSAALEQFAQANVASPLVRVEPLDSIRKISEDRLSFVQLSTFDPPVQETFPNAPLGTALNIYPNAVPYTLADVTAFVARDNPAAGAPRSQVLYANAQTAAKEAEGGTRAGGGIFPQRVRDITTSPDGLLVGPAFEPVTGQHNDATTGRFSQINSDGTASGQPNTSTGIQTIEIVQTNATTFTSRQVRQGNADVGIGMTFTALKYADDNNNALTLFGVAQRGAGNNGVGEAFNEAIMVPAANNGTTTTGIAFGTGVARNILYRLNPVTQDAISPVGGNIGDRTADARATGTGTDVREFGVFADIDSNLTHYNRRSDNLADVIVVRREAKGDIVGITEIGNFIYGVTDQGELWRMQETSWTNGFRGAELIATNLPVGMTGLSKGPRNLVIDTPKDEFIIDMPYRIDGGAFQLSFGGQQTADIPFNATNAQIQAALELLPTIGAGNIVAKGGPMPDSPVSISFTGTLVGDLRAVNFVASPTNPLSIAPFASISRPDAVNQFVQNVDYYRLKIPTETTSGTYSLQYNAGAANEYTSALAYNSGAFQIQSAILAIPSIQAANALTPGAIAVQVRQVATGVYDIALNGTALPTVSLSLGVSQASPFSNSFVISPPTVPGAVYRLQFGTDKPVQLSSSATATDIELAILTSSSIAAANAALPGAITVTVTPSVVLPGSYTVVFGGLNLPFPVSLGLQTSLTSTRPAPATTVTRQSITDYSSLLFGVTPNGTMHAFDVNGLPQGVFTGGKSSTISDFNFRNGYEDSLSSSGSFGSDVQGIDFAALDVNLWHVTSARDTDTGHGTIQTFNGSRLSSLNGGNSLHFGLRANNSTTGRQPGNWSNIYDLAGGAGNPLEQTYDLPGGARGAIESNPIDLKGYTPDDQPTLYFNYFLETENSNSSTTDNINMQDAFRVYGYGPDGKWILLATNNSTGNADPNPAPFVGFVDEFDTPVSGYQDKLNRSYRPQEVFDQGVNGVTTWRQARINLAPLAGMQDARLRFEFSSNGDFRTGDPLRGGIELTAVSGDRIKKGDGFTILPVTTDPFGPPPTPISFVFDVDGSVAPASNVIPVNGTMTAVDVRDQVRRALARVLNGDASGVENVLPYPVYQNTVRLYNHTVVSSGPLQATTNRGADKLGPYTNVFPNFDPVTGETILGDLTGTKDFQRAFRGSQNNSFEGVYIDDIIIGFAERGEQVLVPGAVAAPTATDFDPTPFYERIGGPAGIPSTQTEVGAYQLEIRTAAEYVDQGSTGLVNFTRTFDTNDRLSDQVAIIVNQDLVNPDPLNPKNVVDGDTFTIDDGYSRVIFEFDIRTNLSDPASVGQGHIAVPLVLPFGSAKANSSVVATAIRDAINGNTSQGILRVTAGLRGQLRGPLNTDIHKDASNIVEIFAKAGSLPVSSITSNSKALQTEFGPNPADFTGGFLPNIFPPVQVSGVFQYGKDALDTYYSADFTSDIAGKLPYGEDLGDSNRYRDQGQLIISSNLITDSNDYGIVIDAGNPVRTDLTRAGNPLTARPTPGAVRNLGTLNNENLAPGAVIVNNVLARNRTGGILLSGAGASTAGGVPPITVDRVINNTIYGNLVPSGTGIEINQGASPTLMNNIIASNAVGISGGASTILGGNLYSENTTNFTAATPIGSFDIFLNPGEQLFKDLTNDKFYLSALSKAIDSSLASLEERPGLTSVKSSIDRLPSSMIAPDLDVGGLLRKDDPDVSTPQGQGQNVFIDRGAVDRADFSGPFASLRRPLDNDISSGDIDPNSTYVKLLPSTPSLDFFEILLEENQGTGADANSVTASSVMLTENGRLLVEGLDYVFGYSVNSRTIRLTPLSGVWRRDSVYEVTVNNRQRVRVATSNGDTLLNGTVMTATRSDGSSLSLEYDAGYVVKVPQTTRLQVPSLGSTLGGIADGQTFTIALNAANVTFELTTDANTGAGSVPVPIPANATATAVRDAILSILQSSNPRVVALQLSPKAVGTDEIHLGTGGSHVVSVGTSSLTMSGVLQGITDGQSFLYKSGSNPPVIFEFNQNGGATQPGSIEIPFVGTDTNEDIAAKIANVILASGIVTGGTSPVSDVGGGVVQIGGKIGDIMDVSGSTLILLDSPGVNGKLVLQMPNNGTSVFDGQTFTLQTPTGVATFAFTKTAPAAVGTIPINVNNFDTAALIASKVIAAVASAGLGLTPTNLSVNQVLLNEPLGSSFSIGTAPFVVSGVAGGALAVPIIPSASFTDAIVAGQIIKVLNSLPKPQFQDLRAISLGGNAIMIDGITALSNATSTLIPGIIDLSGNALLANRPNGYTQFTVAMPDAGSDFGDAIGVSLLSENGAQHVQYPVDVERLLLGSLVDMESDGQPSSLANGDDLNGSADDEDGVQFLNPFNANSPPANIIVSSTGVGFLDAWIDWDGNGVFDPQEKIVDSLPVTTGSNTFTISPPSSATLGTISARFRLSSTGGLSAYGMAIGGEVEDYSVTVFPGSPPTANPDGGNGYNINEDSISPLIVSAPGILANDTDPDVGQTLSVFDSNPSLSGIQPLSAPTSGTLVLNSDGSFSYLPKPNFSGVDTFTYYASDSTGLRSILPTTVTINVNDINDAPEFALSTAMVNVNEDETNTVGVAGQYSIIGFATGVRPGPAGANSEDNQTVTFNVVALEPSFFAVAPTISSDGTLTFKLAADRNRTFPNGLSNRVLVQLIDSGSGVAPNVNTSSIVTFSIDIAPVNDAPVLDGYSATVEEDSTTTFTALSVLAGDLPGATTATDEAGQIVTITSIAGQSANGGTVAPFFNGQSLNTFNYTPAPNFVGTDTVTYTVSDNASPTAGTSIGTMTFTVTAVNDAPVFNLPASLTVAEDQSSTSFPAFVTGIGPGPIGSGDEVGQSVTFDVIALDPSFYTSQPTITSDGTLSFTLAPNRNRDFLNGLNNRVQVVARDDGSTASPNVNTSNAAFFTINITPVNDAPIPGSFQTSVAEDIAMTYPAAQILANALQGPSDATDELTQTLTITQINQQSVRGGVINAVIPNPSTGVVTSFRYIPPSNFVGTDTIFYTLADSGSPSLTAIGTITINVTPVNDAPEFLIGSDVIVSEDSAAYSGQWVPFNSAIPPVPGVFGGPVNAADELQSQTVQFEVSTTNASLFSQQPAISSTGVLTFTPAKDANGLAVVSVTAVDSGSSISPNVNRSQTVSFTIGLGSVNDEPIFSQGGNITVNEDSGNFSQNWATGILPAAGLAGAPQTASDESSQTVSFVFLSNSNSGLFSAGPSVAPDGTLTFTPALNQNGIAVVTVVARDSGSSASPNDNESEIKTFTISVTAANDPPVGVSDSFTTTEDQLLSPSTPTVGLLPNDSDPDGNSFSVIAGNTTSTQGATVVLRADGTFDYDPRQALALQALKEGEIRADTFTYRLQDSTGDQSQAVTVTITVNGINDIPIAVNDIVSVAPSATTTIDVLKNDIDPDSQFNLSSLQLGLLPSNGTVAKLANGQFTYTPNPGFRGTDSFTYQISDTTGLISNEATVTVGVNRPPVALADSVMLLTNGSIVINVLGNDSDPDGNSTINPNSVAIVTQPNDGTAVVQSGGSIRFTPTTGFTGTSTFRYTISDTSFAVSDSALVTIRVASSLYQNPNNRFDVNADGFVSPVDALIVINDLQRRGTRTLSPTEFTPPPYIDVDGSGSVAPIDVLNVINFLNTRSRTASGEGEATPTVSAATPAVTVLSGTTIADVVMVTPEQYAAAVSARMALESREAKLASVIEDDYLVESVENEALVESLAGSSNSRKRLHQTDVAFADALDELWDA